MIEVECECGRVIKTKDENAGKKAKCPDCGEIVQLPAARKAGAKSPATSSSKKPAASAVKSKRRPVPEDEFDDGDAGADEDFGDDEAAELPRPKSKKSGKKSKTADDGGEPSGKKKKKKKGGNDEELNKKIIIGTCVFFGLAFLGLIGYGIYAGLGALGGGGGDVAEVPKEYEDFSHPQGSLRLKVPKGWEQKSAGGSGGVPASASFTKGGVTISFKGSESGASKWMALNANGADTSKIPDTEKPISKLHEMHHDSFAEQYSGYEEVGQPMMWNPGGNEFRVSEFTAREGLLGSIHGYRVTMPGVQSQLNVTCKCSPDQWEKFKDVFKTVVTSANSN